MPLCVNIQMKAIELYFQTVVFISLLLTYQGILHHGV